MAVFWIICGIMALVVASVLAAPLLRPGGAVADNPDLDIYKGQLAEVDRDIARGVLNSDEADRARTEISRRLLLAGRATTRTGTAPPAASRMMAGAVALFLLSSGFWVYLSIGAPNEPDQPLAARLVASDDMRTNRPDQSALEAAAPPPPPMADLPPDYEEQIAQLRLLVPTRPDDLQGWTLLAFHETRLGNYAAAARAQDRVVALQGGDVPMADLERQADLLVSAANGIVSPQAEQVARTLLNRDMDSIAGRYYMGALYNQTGRPDLAVQIWDPIVQGDAQTFHANLARAQIEDAAIRAGTEYQMPGDMVGPNSADIAAARDMPEAERQVMIGGMVNRLAERLATAGGTAQDWARLIAAYGVLGETQSATAVWTEAQTTFAGDSAAMQVITTAARSAGVAE